MTVASSWQEPDNGETFVVAHIHQGAVGTEGPPVELLFGGPPTSASKIEQSARRRQWRT
jgi:hypothetical protein